MNINLSLEKLSIICRAELFLLKAEAKRSRMITLVMLAVLAILVIAIICFNFSTFFYLIEDIRLAKAALILGGANLLFALMVVFLIRFIHPGREELEIKRVSEITRQSFAKEVQSIAAEAKLAQHSFAQIQSSIKGSFDSYSVLLPILSQLLKAIKKEK